VSWCTASGRFGAPGPFDLLGIRAPGCSFHAEGTENAGGQRTAFWVELVAQTHPSSPSTTSNLWWSGGEITLPGSAPRRAEAIDPSHGATLGASAW